MSKKVFLTSFLISFILIGSSATVFALSLRKPPKIDDSDKKEKNNIEEQLEEKQDEIISNLKDEELDEEPDEDESSTQPIIQNNSQPESNDNNDNEDEKEWEKDKDDNVKQKDKTPSYDAESIIIRYDGILSTNKLRNEIKKVAGLKHVKVTHLSGSIYKIESKDIGVKDNGKGKNKDKDEVNPQYVATLEKVKTIEGVWYSEPDYMVETFNFTSPPNDAFYNDQWALNNTGQSGGTADADMDVEEAWGIEQGSSDVIVAVIDTGVAYDHPDLNDNILKDGSGNIIGYDYAYGDNDPYDGDGHGTHCAGVIAAEADNGIGVAGICPNCKIMPLKFLDDGGYGYTSDAILSIRFAMDNNANVLSNSWGSLGYSQALQDIINEAYEQGIVVIAAAGNDNSSVKHYPSSMQNVISVAATDHNDARASFSNYGNDIDVTAPGVKILSTFPVGAYLSPSCNEANHPNAGYGYCVGTSMAAPQVAGIAGLIMSNNSTLNSDQVVERIYTAVDDLGSSGWDMYFGYGRVNAHYSVDTSLIPSYLSARITYPLSNQLFGESISIKGFSFGSDFSHYIVEVGYGQEPSEWQTIGITLENGGAMPVLDDILGYFDSTGLEPGTWTIRLSVYDSVGSVSQASVGVSVSDLLEQGFPVQTWHGSGSFKGGQAIHTLVADITGDSKKEIIVTALATGPLYAFDYQGNLLPGWPVFSSHGGAAYPASYGGLVFAGYYGDDIAAFNAAGDTVWEISSSNYVASPPSIGYLTTEGKYGLFIEEQDRHLHGYDISNGSQLTGWPVYGGSSSQELHTAAIADIDGNGEIEMITASGYSSGGGDVHVINKDGSILWSKSFARLGSSTYPVVGDVDGDGNLEVIVISELNKSPWTLYVNVLDSAGNVERSWALDRNVGWATAPALADMDGDFVPEIVVQTNGRIEVFDGMGNKLPGWPLIMNPYIGNSSPVIGDVDGDLLPEVIVTIDSQYVYVIDVGPDGSLQSSSEFQMRMRLDIGGGAVPAIDDIDNDGHNEIIITGDYWDGRSGYKDKIWVFDLNRDQPFISHGCVQWGQFGHDAQHTGTYVPCPREGETDLSVSITDDPDPVLTGYNLTYSIGVTNNGAIDATGVNLLVDLPDSVAYSDVIGDGVCGYSRGSVNCQIESISIGSTAQVDITVVPLSEQGDRTITVDAFANSAEQDSNLDDNYASESTDVLYLDLSPPVMIYPLNDQVLEYNNQKSYVFKAEKNDGVLGLLYAFIQDGVIIHEEWTENENGELAIHPWHNAYGAFREGEVIVWVRALKGDPLDPIWTEIREIRIFLIDLDNLQAPTVNAPVNGDTIRYHSTYTIEIEPMMGASYYLVGIYQDGELVYERRRQTEEFSIFFSKEPFEEGDIEIWARAWVGNRWTPVKRLTVTLDSDAE